MRITSMAATYAANEGGEAVQRGGRGGAIAGGHEVEQQPADHGQAEAAGGRIAVLVDEPRRHRAGQQLVERRLPVGAAGIALEEQALERPQRGVAEVGPQRAEPLVRRTSEGGHELGLTGLHRLHDGDHQVLSRPEVVDQHPVAGADVLGDVAQRTVADAVLGAVGDDRREQVVAAPDVTRP